MIMKQLWKGILIVTLLLPFSMKAVTIDGLIYSYYSDGTATVTGYEGEPEIVTIPNSIEVYGKIYNIISIKEKAFYNCTSLREIIFPHELNLIGERAFYNCTSLREIIFPDKLDLMGEWAFYGCKQLTNFNLPSGLIKIEDCAFWDCQSITEIVLPDGLEIVGGSSFEGCFNLRYISIPPSLKKIGAWAFFGTKIEKVDITNLEAWCQIDFGYQDSSESYYSNPLYPNGELYLNGEPLVELEIPESIEQINVFAFQGSQQLEKIILPQHPIELGGSAFNSCKNLKYIENSEYITDIGQYCFQDCVELESIEFGNSIKSIGLVAFRNCKSLTSLVLPSNIRRLESEAFYGCSNLKSIICYSVYPPYCGSNTFYNVNRDNCILRVPYESIDDYKNHNTWKTFTQIKSIEEQPDVFIVIVPDNVTLEIGETFKLAVETNPEFNTSSLIWTSTNPEIATVNNEGIITGISEGQTQVIVRSDEIDVEAICEVLVEKMSGIPIITNRSQNNFTKVYTLQGVLIEHNLDRLPAGIYIVVAENGSSYKIKIN